MPIAGTAELHHIFSKVQSREREPLCALLAFSHSLKLQTSGKVCKLDANRLSILWISPVGIRYNQWNAILLNYLVDMFHNAQMPQCYLLCLAKVVEQHIVPTFIDSVFLSAC